MNDNIERIQKLAGILMDQPWRVLNNPYPPAVLNVTGKAFHLCALRIEGLGDEEMARTHYKAALTALMASPNSSRSHRR